ncbi:MAG TPA: SUF system NifU family Fe-S cluster assembly protein [Gammaproteobacteria bacterium]|nr:SUF system NifU family Fe-S cluster assembly protein [Xanthomonadales bacterium]MCB1594145.1 SUF system NifU family Fe-S cluster assembly protein [Xanthomonadales bacterium]HOP23468.1 SUF system NifU family Fe-S cluster assembly protein [Gammaproteobacteria bacterium]HPI95154.1 SUF system NifU family Fe-S cluster assembly protein [Gammaproteobacteria bacterium]HPQ86691.1 SUF system NifU family Fe-S cluster assembly protein [Gammaproteobacteria bacterium]
MDIKQLYKQTVLQHNRNPQNYGTPENFTHKAEGLNAICGDQVFVYLNVVDDVIESIFFDGESCAISTASSSLMTEFLTSKTVQQAKELFTDFCILMDKNSGIDSMESLGIVNTIAGVKNFPARIKSATLCWHAMNAALDGKETATTE